ncbi:MAG: rhodanese-like domain-containing protein, partial [Bacteroidota bacterium]|nr:rhodanese-like domain-containing protein [Bacteroidota bacterium]
MLFHPLRLAVLLCISTFFFACNSLGQHPEEGGILENISNEVLAKELMDKALILDVRTPEETQLGIIEGATVINFHDDD